MIAPKNSNVVSGLFVEKLQPKSFDKMIMLPRLRNAISSTVENLNLHYLFAGTAGLGKSTAARIITSKYPTLFLNISEDGNIDTIREKITNWCSSVSLTEDGKPKIKCVILDEMDGASEAFYKGLRGTIEKFQKQSRFIGTCNFINKIPDPIISRFTVINFNPINSSEELYLQNEYLTRAEQIFKICKIDTSDSELLKAFVKACYPDMRKMITQIQNFQISGITKLTPELVNSAKFEHIELYKLIANPNIDSDEFYKLLIGEYKEKYREILNSLGSEFLQWLSENFNDKYRKHLPEILDVTANWQYKMNHLIDPALAMMACAFNLQSIVKK
jgi:DNA polymerase III delta prime subunit